MKIRILVSLLAGLIVCGCINASAQTSRRRTAKPLATPLPTLSGAEIISRAADLQEPTITPSADAAPQKPTGSATTTRKIRDLSTRVDKLETRGTEDPDAKQRRMLLNLDILTRAEQRSEALRKQLFDMTEKENSVKARLDQIDIDSRPEMIERSVQIAGSSRPEEVREARRRSLESEKANLESLLTQIQTNRTTVSASLEKADAMVEKLRAKLDKDIDDNFLKDDTPDERELL